MPTVREHYDVLSEATLALLHPLLSVFFPMLSVPTQSLNPIWQILGDFFLIIVFRFDLAQLLALVMECFETKASSMLAWFVILSRFCWHYLNLTWLRVAITILALYLIPALFTGLVAQPYEPLHSNTFGHDNIIY